MADYLFSRIVPRPELDWSQVERLAHFDSYGQHQAVWELFDLSPDGAERGRVFLFRHECHGDLPAFYIVSRDTPRDQHGLWDIRSKLYAPQLEAGDQLHFKVRVNPVVRRNGKRHDVVMDAKQRLGWKELPPVKRPPVSALAYEAGTVWLASQAEKHGFTFAPTSLIVDGYCTHAVQRRGRDRICFSTLDFAGILTVVNPEQFVHALYRGIGPAKGFGCGLLLVKRSSPEIC